MSLLWCFDHQFLQYLAPEMKYSTDRYRISNVQRVSIRWGAATCSNFKATSLWHRFPCQPAKGLPAVALDPPVHAASWKQTERLGGEISLTHSCATPNRLQIASKPIYCISQSALSAFLDGLERRQIDLLRFTSDKGPDLSTEGRNHLEASKPRSAELAAVASSSCSKQNSFTLSVRNRCGSNSLRFKFTSIDLRVCKIRTKSPPRSDGNTCRDDV